MWDHKTMRHSPQLPNSLSLCALTKLALEKEQMQFSAQTLLGALSGQHPVQNRACVRFVCAKQRALRKGYNNLRRADNKARHHFLSEPACSEQTLSWTRLYQTWNFKLCILQWFASGPREPVFIHSQKSIFRTVSTLKKNLCLVHVLPCPFLNICLRGCMCMHSKQGDKWDSQVLCNQSSCRWEPGCLKAARDDVFKVRLDRALSNLICPDLICLLRSS